MIRKSPVRLIDEDGTQLGIVALDEARTRAKEKGLDLVEVGAGADPPVVRILDWGKLKYEREKKARESRKKTHVIDVKEVKYRPNIDEHDYDIKTQRARRGARGPNPGQGGRADCRYRRRRISNQSRRSTDGDGPGADGDRRPIAENPIPLPSGSR
jgi:translation initiation factor IF-3